MGYGNYSYEAHLDLVEDRKSTGQAAFTEHRLHPLMDPQGVRVRESRDSPEHPETLSLVFALDVTGSMGNIPRLLSQDHLPGFMKLLYDCGVPDPQLLFMAVGDAVSDQAPLQVGQFESTGELIDQWLTRTWLEGRGGGTNEESYELAMYFLAQHTELDCVVKRGKKGYLFMTGDENPYEVLSRHLVERWTGDRLDADLPTEAIVAELQKSYVPFFIVPDPRRLDSCEVAWRRLLGDHLICLRNVEDICHVAAGLILLNERRVEKLEDLRGVFLGAGLSEERVPRVLQTLAPFATTLGMGPPSILKQVARLVTGLLE